MNLFIQRKSTYLLLYFFLFSIAIFGHSIQHHEFTPIASCHSQKIAIVGTGYVGLVLGAGLAELGHQVTCVDIVKEKIDSLQKGVIPIYEPGLQEVVETNVQLGRLKFSHSIDEAIQANDVIFIAVGTPTGLHGEANISAVEAVAATIGKNLNHYKVICIKSTVPIGMTQKISKIIARHIRNNCPFDVAFNPEFLREGSAVSDFFYPDRIVIGVEADQAQKIMEEIYRPLIHKQVSFLKTNIATAEAIKYASNAFLAVKIAFINEFSHLCNEMGVDVTCVATGMGLDKRIGPDFLKPGPGFGGSCFPKDTLALLHTAQQVGVDLKIIRAAVEANENHKKKMVEKLSQLLEADFKDKTIAILGLAFKANTDDVRHSPAIDIIKEIVERGGNIKAYDPMAMSNMRGILPHIEYCNHAMAALKNSDAVMILTEWDEFKKMDLNEIKSVMKTPILIDTRNVLNMEDLKRLGFQYTNLGSQK